MKKLLAKLQTGSSVIVFDDAEAAGIKNLYKEPNIKNAIEFDLSHILGEDQWYYVVPVGDQKIKMMDSYLSEDLNGIGLDTINEDSALQVRALYLVSGEEKYFTKITSRLLPKSSKYISIGETPSLVEQKSAITVTGQLDAYWSGSWLYFKKFAYVQTMFPGMNEFYREATERETNLFLSCSLFELKSEMSSDMIGNRNRRMIAAIIDSKSADLEDPDMREKYLDYAKTYNLDLEIEDDKIMLIDNSDISTVINLLNENFYTTPITEEKREIRTSKKMITTQRKRAK